ncbi:hypothetical protein BB561_000857 [Smittium simulii]|uniref:PABS domain-containing protein n=1 Tax=Smittium simulii TaxID=133385 RepID=A0A2T9YX66_9FUNG|nr:hypothetical protein BB561_000857 [Smittium simulii]
MVIKQRLATQKQKPSSPTKTKLSNILPLPVTIQKLIDVDFDFPAYFAGLIITYNLIISFPTSFQIGQRYLEPVYGSVLSARGQFIGMVASIIFGVIFGNQAYKLYIYGLNSSLLKYKQKYDKQLIKPKTPTNTDLIDIENEPSQYMHAFDTGIINIIAYVFDVSAILIASIPIRLETVFRFSTYLGPIWGPIASHSVSDYPVFVTLGIIAMLVSIRISFFGKTGIMKIVIGYAYFFVVGVASASFHSVLLRTPVCESIFFQAFLFGLSGIILKLLVIYKNGCDKKLLRDFTETASKEQKNIDLDNPSNSINNQENNETNSSRSAAEKKKLIKKNNLKMFLSFLPFVLTLYLIYKSAYENMNCSKGVSYLHNKDPKFNLVFKHESPFGFVEVIDLKSEPEYRVMRVSNSIIGGTWKSTNESIYGTFYYFDGTGISAASFHNQGVFVDVVEINPSVYFGALKYFEFPEDINSKHFQDGRYFVENAKPDTYDYIIHDIFSGGPIMSHMFSQEFMKGIEKILKNDGIFVMNYVGYLNDTLSIGTFKNTLGTVFNNIRCFVDSKKIPNKLQNMVFFASKKAIDFEFPESVINPDPEHITIKSMVLKNMFENEMDFTNMDLPQNSIITDINNPLSGLELPNAIKYWHEMHEYFSQDFWINF